VREPLGNSLSKRRPMPRAEGERAQRNTFGCGARAGGGRAGLSPSRVTPGTSSARLFAFNPTLASTLSVGHCSTFIRRWRRVV